MNPWILFYTGGPAYFAHNVVAPCENIRWRISHHPVITITVNTGKFDLGKLLLNFLCHICKRKTYDFNKIAGKYSKCVCLYTADWYTFLAKMSDNLTPKAEHTLLLFFFSFIAFILYIYISDHHRYATIYNRYLYFCWSTQLQIYIW